MRFIKGIEVWARASQQLLVPIAIFLIFFMLVIMVPDMHVKEMLPLWSTGPSRSCGLDRASPPGFRSSSSLRFFRPICQSRSRRRRLKWTHDQRRRVLMTMLSINLSVLFLFGELNKELQLSFLDRPCATSRLSDFIEHIESF